MALLSESADVRVDPALVSAEAVAEAVEGCGFGARLVSRKREGGAEGVCTVKLDVRGMHCSACSSGGAGQFHGMLWPFFCSQHTSL